MHKMLLDLPETIESNRLIIRPYRAGDGQVYYSVCQQNRDHLLPFEKGNPALDIHTPEDAEILVRNFVVYWLKREAFFFGAWHKETSEWVAQVYVGPVDWDLPEFEIGYFVDKSHEGQGYVTEAVKAVLGFVFHHLHAHRVRLDCNELNVRSWRVAERCGFVREGHFRQTRKHILREDGTYSGDYIYGLLRTEFVSRP